MADITIVNAVRSHNPRVPLGPLYLCSFLEQSGYDVDFRDYQLSGGCGVGTPAHFESWLAESAPVLAISTLSSSLPLVLAAVSRPELRRQVEKVVLGGPGVTSLGREILERFPAVDVVVSGEGEITLHRLMEQLQSGGSLTEIPGITFRHGSQVGVSSPAARIEELDRLPLPAYHKISLREYTELTDWDRIPLAVLSARGCPFACSFCDIPGIWNGGIRYREVASVVEEVKLLIRDHHIDRFHITDDTFVMNRERVLDFCQAIEDEELQLQWSCLGRVDRMDEEILRRLATAGCDTIFYGVESGSDAILERINKGFTVRQAMEIVRLSTQYMHSHVSFIWGFPFETMPDLYDTVITLLAMHRMGAEPHLNLLVPLPSAELHRRYRERELGIRAAEIGWDWAMMENYRYGDDLLELIRLHPDIFAPFYCFDSPQFHEKVGLLESWGLGLGRPAEADATRRSHPGGARFVPGHGVQLPALADGVTLRTIGGRSFVFDAHDCLLYEPSQKQVEFLRACARREDSGEYVRVRAAMAGATENEISDHVSRAVSQYAAKGLLAIRQLPL